MPERPEEEKGLTAESTPDDSAIARFDFSPEELAALSRQGTVCGEERCGRVYFRLRFRLKGKQSVRYLGTDPFLAERVRRGLAKLQGEMKLDRELGRLARVARRSLRDAKRRLAGLLSAVDRKFHGLAIRATGRQRRATEKNV